MYRENVTFSGTAFFISEKELLSACKGFLPARGGLITEKRDGRLVFSLQGASKKQREDAFAFLRQKFGGRIRQGEIVPAVLAFNALKEKNRKLVTAESCTGGLIAKQITDIPGSSGVLWGGFVVYSDQAKQKLLHISSGLLKKYGAVSEESVEAMATAALRQARADYSIAVSGIAGPDGGTAQKPVGTVWFCILGGNGKKLCRRFFFSGTRNEVRQKTAAAAFLILESMILEKDYLDYCRNW